MTVVKRDLATGARSTVTTVPLPPGTGPAGLTANASFVAWFIDKPSGATATVLDLSNGEQIKVASTESSGKFGFPAMSDRLLAWAESSGTSRFDVGGYLFDLDSRQLYSIGNTAGLHSLAVSGEVVAWQESSTAVARPTDVSYVVAKVH